MPASDKPAPHYRLRAHAPDESTRIEVLDGNMRPIEVEQNLGDVSLQLPAGVYSVRFHQGSNFTEKLAALMPEAPVAEVSLSPSEQPAFATAAPVPGTSTTHEWQSVPAQRLSESAPLPPPPRHAGGSHLLLFLRNPFASGALPTGTTLHDIHGEKLVDLDAQGTRDAQAQWLGAHLNLNPGAYRLRMQLDRGSFIEQILYTLASWQTQVFLMSAEQSEQSQEIVRISILMAKIGLGFQFERPDFRLAETALRALGNKQNIPGAVRSEMLWAKLENPMLGIYAGLLHLRRRDIDVGLMRRVFDDLLILVGPLPDVLAIGWAVALRDKAARTDETFMANLRKPDAYATPPMLRESWEHLLRVSADELELIPAGSLADRIGGQLIVSGPWVAWLGELPQPVDWPGPEEIDLAARPERGAPVTGDVVQIHRLVAEGVKFLNKIWVGFRRFLKWAEESTLQIVLSNLAIRLSDYPEARFWLSTRRFSDLERQVAYWLQPTLDPRMRSIMETDPKLERTLISTARERAADKTILLAEFNLSSTTALRATWGIFTKLFLQPVIPNDAQLKTFVEEESRGHAAFTDILRGLGNKASRLCQLTSDRRLNMLEFAFLYYRGSPAEGLGARASIDQLAVRLDEAGFLFWGKEQHKITADNLSLEHLEVKQQVILSLAGASKRVVQRFPAMWQPRVFPTLEEYSPGNLLPLLEGKDVAKETDSTSASGPIAGAT